MPLSQAKTSTWCRLVVSLRTPTLCVDLLGFASSPPTYQYTVFVNLHDIGLLPVNKTRGNIKE